MHRITFVYVWVLLLFATMSVHAQRTYYWNGTGAIHLPNSWGTNLDGSGFRPSNFIGSLDTFVFQSGQTATAVARWEVKEGSKVILQSGAELISGAFNHNLSKVSLQGDAVFSSTHTSYATTVFESIDPVSTVELRGTGSLNTTFRSNYVYGNLGFYNPSYYNLSSALQINAVGTVLVSGTGVLALTNSNSAVHNVGSLVVANESVLRLTNESGSVAVNVVYDFINNGVITKRGSGNASLVFTGVDSGRIIFGNLGVDTDIGFSAIVDTGRTVYLEDHYILSNERTLTNNGLFHVKSGATMSGIGVISGTGSVNIAGTLLSRADGAGSLGINQNVSFDNTGVLSIGIGSDSNQIDMSDDLHSLSFSTGSILNIINSSFESTNIN